MKRERVTETGFVIDNMRYQKKERKKMKELLCQKITICTMKVTEIFHQLR